MHDQDIHQIIQTLRKEVKQWRVPVVGHYSRNPFTVLISCLLSLRTQDKTTGEASARLFRLAKTPGAMAELHGRAVRRKD